MFKVSLEFECPRYLETIVTGAPLLTKKEAQLSVDLFNEIVSFEKNANGEYYNIWESKYGITMDELLPAFDYALQHKPDGISFLYNEPFLEDDERRKKVFEVLDEIVSKRPGLIDTLGSQMHITIGEDGNKIRRCFEDFRILQERTGKKLKLLNLICR